MRKTFHRFICGTLIVTSILSPFAAQTQAAMIGSEQAIQASAAAERAKVNAFLARADVQRELASLGATDAAGRVNALTDDEARSLASRIDALPAGGDISVAAALLIIIILVLLVYLMGNRR